VRAALDRMLAEDEEPDDDVSDQRRHLASGLLHRAIDVGMLPGERVLDRIYRHWFVLMGRALPPFLIGVAAELLLAALRAFMPRSIPILWSLTAIVAIIILLWELLMISNYIDDSFILTNQRIIDVDRSYFIFAESRRETLYRSVQDVSITKPPLGRLFNYGHIHVETAGRAPNIDMRHMSRPRETQERIFALINADREARAEADRKAQRKELHSSVGAVLTALMLVAPDLRALPVATAITRLRAIGLTAVIAGERATGAAAPGVVLEQAPSPGATLLRGSEIALTLSRRPQRR
jgi:membrane protein YdbS with pleckstrin-like domain